MNLRFIAPEEPVWKIRQPDKLTKDFDELMDDIHGQPAHNSILWSLRAMSLLTEAIELKEGKSTFSDAAKATELPLPNDPIVAQVLEMIWTCSHRDLSVDQLASQLPVTRRTLDRRFQEVLGRTVLDEITNCRLSRAKRLLAETMLPIKTVAQLAGFSNTERMRMVFLKMEKMTPIDYRFFKQ
jgi:AraC-like DNA-binding protein